MPTLITYRRVVDAITTHSLQLPQGSNGLQTGQELCTLPDGRTVVVLFDGNTLPTGQPAAIAASIVTLTMPLAPDLLESIKAASPHVRLINTRVEEKIREKYSAADENKFARIAYGVALSLYSYKTGEQAELQAFGAYCELCRAWGNAEKTKLGL